LYKIRGAWRSVNKSRFSRELEAAKPNNIFFSSKLTEPRANQPTGRQVSKASEFVFFGKYKLLIFVQINQLLIG
jgi:hypothetical protein